tara:strand:+ start:896 stop:1402 length:507 start_codon:yes stop_codon:yes gene_type:complete
MEIQHSTVEDVDNIFYLYKTATNFQKKKAAVPWPDFDRTLVIKEISEQKQWKIIIDGEIACVWAIAQTDPQIWLKRNNEPAIYIHRISTNPSFRGRELVKEIVKWSIDFGKKNKKKYIRMDTVGENIELINYYKKCGFEFLGLSKLKDTSKLPAHYQNATVCLFQMLI